MQKGQKYVADIFYVKLTKKDIPQLLKDTAEISGWVAIAQGDFLIGVENLSKSLNVDYDKPMVMLIRAYTTEEQLKTLRGYRRIEGLIF